MRCIVVGAGMIGSCISLRLVQAGYDVTLVEADAPAGGTSGRSLAWVNSNAKRPYSYFELNRQGIEAYRRLIGELEDVNWFFPYGSIEWLGDTPEEIVEQERRIAELIAWNYPVERLRPEALARLEPDLAAVHSAYIAAFPGEAFIYPRRFLAHILDVARDHGLHIRTGERVAQVDVSGNQTDGVVLASGERLPGDAVIVACGIWTPDLLAPLGAHVPLIDPAAPNSTAVGMVVTTAPVTTSLRHYINAPRVTLRPEMGGRIMLDSPETDTLVRAGDDMSPGHPAALELLRLGAEVLPVLQETRVERATVCIRPMPIDEVSIIGWVPGFENLYVAVTHSGVTLGPLFGECIARELAGDAIEILEPFRPGRFSASVSQDVRFPPT